MHEAGNVGGDKDAGGAGDAVQGGVIDVWEDMAGYEVENVGGAEGGGVGRRVEGQAVLGW